MRQGHLSGIAQGISEGKHVTEQSVIGYSGATGGPKFPVGYPHLYRAIYRKPGYNPYGSPYGGAGLKVVYYHYVGTAAGGEPGVYTFGADRTRRVMSKGSWISN